MKLSFACLSGPILSLSIVSSVIVEGSGDVERKELSVVDLLIPSPARLALLLDLDLRLPEEDMPIKGSSVLLVRRDSIPKEWFQVSTNLQIH